MSRSYEQRLCDAIPGGAHTYSRGKDQFPANAPEILSSGKGCHVFSADNRRLLDYGMGLRSVGIGYAEEEINRAAIAQIEQGNNLTRASLIELEAAERLIDIIDSADMVKFTKNGSSAVSAAVKLARAYTNRKLVARCSDHPFFSFDDWFIGSTPITRGIPEEVINQTKLFSYNNISTLKALIEQHPEEIACVVLEAATTEPPKPCEDRPEQNFLHEVQALCQQHGIIFILDEMITGFRWHMKGAQHFYGIEPDLCTFGKAMANGFSVAAVAGRKELMTLGSIDTEGQERLFLLSTTHGAEMSGLGAFVASMDFMETHNVQDHYWAYGRQLIDGFNQLARKHNLEQYFQAGGIPCSPWYQWKNATGEIDLSLRTLFLQEMVKQDVLIPWIAICYRHDNDALKQTLTACDQALETMKVAVTEGTVDLLQGPAIKPVFRRYN